MSSPLPRRIRRAAIEALHMDCGKVRGVSYRHVGAHIRPEDIDPESITIEGKPLMDSLGHTPFGWDPIERPDGPFGVADRIDAALRSGDSFDEAVVGVLYG